MLQNIARAKSQNNKSISARTTVAATSAILAGLVAVPVFAATSTASQEVDVNLNVVESISMMVTPESAFNDGNNNIVLDIAAGMYQEVGAHIKAATNSLFGLTVVVNDSDDDTGLNHTADSYSIPTSTNIEAGTAGWGIKAVLPDSEQETIVAMPKKTEEAVELIRTNGPSPIDEFEESDIDFVFSTALNQPIGTYTNTVTFTATVNASSTPEAGKYLLRVISGTADNIPAANIAMEESVDLSTITAQLSNPGFSLMHYEDRFGNQYAKNAVTNINPNGVSIVTLTAKWKENEIFSGITTMQEMTPAICAAATTPGNRAKNYDTTGEYHGDTNYVPETVLTDSRDGEQYTVRKLADGNCWMTQNLRLVGPLRLTPEDSDVSSYFDIPEPVYWFETAYNTNQIGKIRPDTARYGGGAYYPWFTATAGTGQSIQSSGEAYSSICPKGWRLPPYTGNRSFQNLIYTAYNYYYQSWRNTTIEAKPFEFYRSGRYWGTSGFNSETSAMYWTSTAISSTSAGTLYISDGSFNYSHGAAKTDGNPMRCVAY